MNLYLFDFDGTLYKKDSMIEYIKFIHGNIFKYYFINFMFSPFLFLIFFSIVDTQTYKNYFLKMHFFIYSKSFLESHSKLFVKRCMSDLYTDVRFFIKNNIGEKCIVTASLDIWMNQISKELGIELLCTKSVFKNEKFNSILKNCNNSEKVNRINKKYVLSNYDNIFIYGNSKGDTEMYELGKVFHNFFKDNDKKK